MFDALSYERSIIMYKVAYTAVIKFYILFDKVNSAYILISCLIIILFYYQCVKPTMF